MGLLTGNFSSTSDLRARWENAVAFFCILQKRMKKLDEENTSTTQPCVQPLKSNLRRKKNVKKEKQSK